MLFFAVDLFGIALYLKFKVRTREFKVRTKATTRRHSRKGGHANNARPSFLLWRKYRGKRTAPPNEPIKETDAFDFNRSPQIVGGAGSAARRARRFRPHYTQKETLPFIRTSHLRSPRLMANIPLYLSSCKRLNRNEKLMLPIALLPNKKGRGMPVLFWCFQAVSVRRAGVR